MEFNRFVQYAKYDLTINKAFYRNTSIVTASIITGIAVMGFLIRWTMIRNLNVGVDSDETIDSWYYSINATVKVIFGVVGVIIVLAIVIVIVVWRNRTITVKYSKLLQSQEVHPRALRRSQEGPHRQIQRAGLS